MPKVQNALNNDEKTRLKLAAGLDIAKTKKLIQAQLATIANQTNAPTIKVGVEVGKSNTVQNVVQELKNVQVQAQQTVSTVNQSITNLVDKFVKPITPVFNKDGLIDAGKTIEKLQQRFQELGQVSVKGTYSDIDATDSLDKMLVKIKALNGETRTLKFELDKSGKAFHLTSGTSDNSGIFKLVQDFQNAIADYEQKIAQFKSTNHELLTGLSEPIGNFEAKLEGLKNGTSTIDEVKNSFQALNAEAAKITANFSRQLSPTDAAIRNVSKGDETIRKLRTEISELSNAPVGINEELNKCAELLSNIKRIESEQDTTEKWAQEYKDWRKSVEELTSKIKALKSYESDINSSLSQLNKIQNSVTFRNNASSPSVIKAKAEIDSLIERYRSLQTQLQGEVTPEGLKSIETELETLSTRFNSVSDGAKNLQTELANTNGLDKKIQKTNLLIARIEAYRAANSKAEKSYGNLFDDMLSELKSGNLDDIGVDRVSRQFQELRQEINLTGKTGKTFWTKLREQAEKFGSWMTLTGFVSSAWRDLKKMVTHVIELDSAMTDLKKVTDETETSYTRFLKNTAQQAKDLKIDLSDLVNQTAEWSKKGYNMAESSTLSKSSGIYSVVGEVDNATAVQDLITVMKSYNMTAEEAIDIVDRFNNISNKYSVNAADIGTMLSNSISSLSIAGNSLDQAIAMGTTITEITGDASEAGNTLKVLSMRLRGASTEIENIGESTDGMAESTAKLREKILALTNVTGKGGFDIMADDNSFKSTYEIMQGISEVWQDISDVNQAALIELIAGKQRGNTVSALLTNMAQANNILNDSLNSSGSAMEEYSLYLESIEGKIQGFKTSFEVLSNTIIDSDLVKGIVDIATGILDFLDGTIDRLGTIPTLLTAISAGMAFKNVGEFKNTPPYAPLQLCA